MTTQAIFPPSKSVSRVRYERERMARLEAERLLEAKSRELWEANEALRNQAQNLEGAVRQRTADLEAAKRMAERANEAKSRFLAMISHDIRTPLNGVLGMAQVLQETTLDPEQGEMVGLIISSGETLTALLNDVLDLSKIEAQQMQIERIPLGIDLLVGEIGRIHRHLAQEKGLGLDVFVDDQMPRRLIGDPTRLRQVLNNLLSNALKFTETGGVRLTLCQVGNCIRLDVHDTGPGVPTASQDKLFKAFVQADYSVARRFGGTGLGLTISRELCRLMGGDLTYAPSPDGGSCFTATFRAEIAQSGVVGIDTTSLEGARRILEARPWRVLVAEDNRTNQTVLRHLLRPYPVELIMVEDGLAALDHYCQDDFDILLLDINMPKMRGTEAASSIRQIEIDRGLARKPIVALTANVMTHQVMGYGADGFDACVSKPIRRAELVKCMAGLLAGHLTQQDQNRVNRWVADPDGRVEQA